MPSSNTPCSSSNTPNSNMPNSNTPCKGSRNMPNRNFPDCIMANTQEEQDRRHQVLFIILRGKERHRKRSDKVESRVAACILKR